MRGEDRPDALVRAGVTQRETEVLWAVAERLRNRENHLWPREGTSVPVPVGSITDLTVVLRKSAGVDDINAAFREAAASQRLQHYLQYSEAPLVSADLVGNPHSSIFDAPLTEAVGNQVKVLGWYDNEWGFSNRLVEFSERIATAAIR